MANTVKQGVSGQTIEQQGSIDVREDLRLWNGSDFVDVATIEEVAEQVSVIAGGIGNAILTTDPTDPELLAFNTFNLNGGAGVYEHFFSAPGVPIELTAAQVPPTAQKAWQVYRTEPTGYWTLKEVPIDLSNLLKKDIVTNVIHVGNPVDTSYNLGPISTSTHILDFPISPGQVITSITLKGSRAGLLPLKLFRRGDGDEFTFVKSVDIPILTGVGTYTTSIDIDEELYPGFYFGNPTGGQVSYKTSVLQDSYYITGSDVTGTETFLLVTNQYYGINFEVSTIVYGDLKPINDRLAEIEPHFVGNILDTVSSDMSGTGNWVVGIGTPAMDISSGTMKLTFTSSNQGVYLPELVPGLSYRIEARLRKISGNIKRVSIGQFSSTPSAGWSSIPVSTNWQDISFDIVAANKDLYIGALAASNPGGVVEVEYIRAIVTTGLEYETEEVATTAAKLGISNTTNMNLGNVFSSLSKYDKPITIVCALSDSLFANPTGGPIPAPEAATQRPMRLGASNNIPRRIYDFLSWNKPQWRRLDDAAWTKSGTWTAINSTAIFEPTYTTERYTTTVTPSAYAEITVPDGMENFAIIVREFTSLAVLNVTLNGVAMPSGNGVSSYDTNLVGAGPTGNPYKILHFKNLPAGANVIRITKDATANGLFLWGGFWWTGNTLVVMNVAHGGHTMDELINEHINDEVVRNNFDAILFQVTEMNEMGAANPRGTESALRYILGSLLADKDVLVTTPHPFGTNPLSPSTNYYDMYKVPLTMKELNLLVKKVAHDYGHPVLDKFSIFERKTINRGGTLENGDAGLWYTHDGQHHSPTGMDEDWNMIKAVLKQIPLYNS